MTEDNENLCESCLENPAGDIDYCPYRQAVGVCSTNEAYDEKCNCCAECWAECKERS